eukprot:gene5303-7075_t
MEFSPGQTNSVKDFIIFDSMQIKMRHANGHLQFPESTILHTNKSLETKLWMKVATSTVDSQNNHKVKATTQKL